MDIDNVEDSVNVTSHIELFIKILEDSCNEMLTSH